MAELLLDSNIRVWVFLPIVVITFLVEIIRHYVTILLLSGKKSDLQQVSDSHALIRSRILRENGRFIPKQSFLKRRNFFNHEERGFFKVEKKRISSKKSNDRSHHADRHDERKYHKCSSYDYYWWLGQLGFFRISDYQGTISTDTAF